MINPNLVGLTVAAQRLLSAAELETEGWPLNAKVVAIELNNGTVIYPAAHPKHSPSYCSFIVGQDATGRLIEVSA